MKNSLLAVLLCFGLGSCLKDDTVSPEIIIEPISRQLISRDSITVDGHLDINVGAEKQEVYAQVQALKSKGVSYVQPVGAVRTDFKQLAGRLPLYRNLYFGEEKPTDSDVQITFEAGKVSSIFLTNFTKLNQWPAKEPISSSVRMGDDIGSLYQKLEKIQANKSYAKKFESISLLFKNLDTIYDPVMSSSDTWYFAYTLQDGLLEKVDIGFANGKVKYLIVERYR